VENVQDAQHTSGANDRFYTSFCNFPLTTAIKYSRWTVDPLILNEDRSPQAGLPAEWNTSAV